MQKVVSKFKMTDLPPIANFLSNCLIVLLIIVFVYALCVRFVPDETIYDLISLPSSDPNKMTYYIDTTHNANDSLAFSSIFNASEIYLSVVIPLYNDEQRLSIILDSTIRYLENRTMNDHSFTWEIIIVDDNPSDKSYDISNSQSSEIRIIKHQQSMGIGASIETGALHSRGKYILIFRPDGSAKIEELEELERKMRQLQAINAESVVVGSRSHLIQNPEFNLIFQSSGEFNSPLFRFFMSIIGIENISDPKCDFKLFSREAARWIFPNQHITQICYGAEEIFIAKVKNMQIAEVPIEWSQINFVKKSFQNKIECFLRSFLDLLQIYLLYRIGFWTIRMKSVVQKENEV